MLTSVIDRIKISVRSCDYAPAEEDSSEGVENSEEGAEEIEEPDSIPAHLTFTKPGTSDVLWVEGLFEDQVFVPVKIQVLDKAVAGDVAESERPDMEHGRVNQYQGPGGLRSTSCATLGGMVVPDP